MSKETVNIYLELAAAKAKQLAHDSKNNKLWPGDLRNGIAEITDALEKARQANTRVDY